MSKSYRISTSRTVKASPGQVFRVVTDPNVHIQIDGSGMLKQTPNAVPLQAVGDTFGMDMDRDPLGDVPTMHKYQVLNTVTKIVPDALLEWNVRAVGQPPSGNVYGWEITAVSPEETEVTNYSDWSGVAEEKRSAYPRVPVTMLEKTVDNLVRLLTSEPLT